MTTLAAGVARSLEAGRGGLVSSLVATAWEATSQVARRLTWGHEARVIAVGGSTLGGSGKTPLAVACARELAREFEGVVLVGHAYGGRPLRARVVTPADDVRAVGDEALASARALASLRAAVVVGPSRQVALAHALSFGRVAVLDGVGQTFPVPADLALLALDAGEPWGAGHCPPAGDLRAAKAAMLAACDRVVRIGEGGPQIATARPVDSAFVRSEGAWLSAELLPWSTLRERRIALWTALARPGRVVRLLAREGVTPALLVHHADHSAPSAGDIAEATARGRRAGVDLWLATSKCVTQLPVTLGGIPVATLAHELILPGALVDELHRAVFGSPPRS